MNLTIDDHARAADALVAIGRQMQLPDVCLSEIRLLVLEGTEAELSSSHFVTAESETSGHVRHHWIPHFDEERQRFLRQLPAERIRDTMSLLDAVGQALLIDFMDPETELSH